MTSGIFDVLVPDVLGEPYLAETITLPPDEEGPVVTTLVVRRAAEPTGRAVLYVHGFCDYFFQTDFAEWWTERGYDFYAVDLRKYGRSLRPHQTPNYVTDLRAHFADLDAAFHRVAERDGHDHVVLSAHSTGGLIVSLWANERKPAHRRHGAELPLARHAGRPPDAGARHGGRQAGRRPAADPADPPHGRRLLRPQPARRPRRRVDLRHRLEAARLVPGLLRLAERHPPRPRRAAARARGRLPGTGALVGRHALAQGDGRRRPQLRHRARGARRSGGGPPPSAAHVTYVAIEGARHDVVLSLPEPRAAAYAEIDRWMSAYVD